MCSDSWEVMGWNYTEEEPGINVYKISKPGFAVNKGT